MENVVQIQSIDKKEFFDRLDGIERILNTILQKEPEFISIKRAADKLDVTEKSVRNYMKRGLIPGKRIGGKLLINKKELDEVLEDVKSLKYKRTI